MPHKECINITCVSTCGKGPLKRRYGIAPNITQVANSVKKNGTISGIRYAWSTYPCCGNLNREYNPCPPNSCPLFAANDMNNISTPAVPFWSQIINDTCVCFKPQTC